MIVFVALGTLRRRVQRDGFFGDAQRVAHQIERFDQFVAGEHVLAAEAIRIRALLNFVSGKRRGHDSRAGLHFDLMNGEPMRRGEQLLDAAKAHGSFRQRDALDARHFAVGGQQQIQLALERNLERVFDVGILPGVRVGLDRAPFRRRARLASADAFAMATASAAQAAIPSRVRRSVEAKPHDPCAITRMPMPKDSDSASVPTCPFFVERSRRRISMTRASA